MNRFPYLSAMLVILASIRLEYNTEHSRLFVPGLAGWTIVLAIVAVVLLFRIVNTVQDACVFRRLIGSRIRCRCDVLIPIALVSVAVKGRWGGNRMTGMEANRSSAGSFTGATRPGTFHS